MMSRYSTDDDLTVLVDGNPVPARILHIGIPSYSRDTDTTWRMYTCRGTDGVVRYFAAADVAEGRAA